MKLDMCKEPCCMHLVKRPRIYCEKHQAQETARIKKAAAQATQRWAKHHELTGDADIYATARWRTLKAEHLRTHPDCRMCGAHATTVDHVVPHKGDTSLAYDPENVQSLCASCHGRKSAQDRWGRRPIPGV